MEATKFNDQCLRTDQVNDQYLRTGGWWIKWIRAKWPYLLPRVDWDVMMGDVDWTSWHHIGSINVEPVWSDPKRRARGARIEDMYYDWRVPNLDHSKLRSSREDFQAHYQDAKEEMSHDDPKTRGRRVLYGWMLCIVPTRRRESCIRALRSCIEAVTHLRSKLRTLGIPLEDEPTHIFCDNESVVTNATKA